MQTQAELPPEPVAAAIGTLRVRVSAGQYGHVTILHETEADALLAHLDAEADRIKAARRAAMEVAAKILDSYRPCNDGPDGKPCTGCGAAQHALQQFARRIRGMVPTAPEPPVDPDRHRGCWGTSRNAL